MIVLSIFSPGPHQLRSIFTLYLNPSGKQQRSILTNRWDYTPFLSCRNRDFLFQEERQVPTVDYWLPGVELHHCEKSVPSPVDLLCVWAAFGSSWCSVRSIYTILTILPLLKGGGDEWKMAFNTSLWHNEVLVWHLLVWLMLQRSSRVCSMICCRTCRTLLMTLLMTF